MTEAWIKRQTASPEARRRYERERLVLWATEIICSAMHEKGIRRSQVAERIGSSRAHITQLLRGSRNMTLGSLADLAWACGHRVTLTVEPIREGAFITSPVHLTRDLSRPVVVTSPKQDQRSGNTVANQLAA
jgi:transcriptional regulator with XRE-family HTH domain